MLDRSEVGKRGYLDRDFRLVHLKDSLAQKIDYHYHEFDKLVIFLGGKVTYVVEGVTYFLKPWDIVLIQHNLIHRPIIHAEEPYERAVLWLGRNWQEARSDPGEPLDACFGWGGTGSPSAAIPASRWTPVWTKAGSRGSTFYGPGRRGVLATHGSSSS